MVKNPPAQLTAMSHWSLVTIAAELGWVAGKLDDILEWALHSTKLDFPRVNL